MSIAISLLALKKLRPGANRVVWPRIDQKTCLKAIVSAGCVPVVIENVLEGDEVRTNVAAVEKTLAEDPSTILAVISTTSCFAPRIPERVVEIAKLCADANVPHIVNNAYGLQDITATRNLTKACTKGRVDCVIQSTDKNFMVPVGGAIIANFVNAPLYGEAQKVDLISEIKSMYPGRASNTAVVDLFITLISMGETGYRKLLCERKVLFSEVLQQAKEVAAKHGERILNTSNNEVSMALTLDSFVNKDSETNAVLSNLGGMLFTRCCSGSRVVTCVANQKVGGIEFQGYGSHIDAYPHPYLAFACAIGVTGDEVKIFMKRLDKTLKELRKHNGSRSRSLGSSATDSSLAGNRQMGVDTEGSSDTMDLMHNLTGLKISGKDLQHT